MQNNQAFVATLRNICAIPGADKIVQADVTLNGIKITQVVVGADTPDGLTVVYFDSNMCLSDELLADEPSLGRYLSGGGRVRVVKLRGIISNGLAVPVEKFARYANGTELVEGVAFTTLGKTPICKKYAPPVRAAALSTGSKSKRAPKVSRMVDGQFHFHVDTEQLARNITKLDPLSVVSISRKLHGTSAIASMCLVKRPKTLAERLRFWDKTEPMVYDMVYASRTVIKNDAIDPGGYYGFDLWREAGEKHFKGKLAHGETVYYEIVGYTPTGGGIQKGYDYGCEPNTYAVYVYRITQTSPDGRVVEYGWQAMKERCREIGVPHVPELYFGRACDHFADGKCLMGDAQWHAYFLAQLKSTYLEKTCPDCKGKMPDEGVVLRVEGMSILAYKLKSESFLLGESKAKDEGTADIEESEASNAEQ